MQRMGWWWSRDIPFIYVQLNITSSCSFYVKYKMLLIMVTCLKFKPTECSGFRPGHSRFREKWLKDIIESKVILMEAIDF